MKCLYLSQTCMHYKSIGVGGMIKIERKSNFPEMMCQLGAVLQQGPTVALTSVQGAWLWWLIQTQNK